MDTFMDIKQFLGFIAANGITAIPQIETADFTPVPGYVPPTYIVWRKANGSKLEQGFNVIAEQSDPFSYLWEVQRFLNLPEVTHISWENFLNPAKLAELGNPPLPGTDAVVGPSFDVEKRLFYVRSGNVQEGAKYTQQGTGRKFIAVRSTPFSIHWKEL